MNPIRLIPSLLIALALAGCASSTEKTQTAADKAPPPSTANLPAIGGAVTDPAATIAANIARAPNLTTLVRLLQAAGLDQTLAGAGPYTLLAPSNEAFSRLQPGTVETLLKPENKQSLVKLLDYVILKGSVTTADLRGRVAASGGSTTIPTMEGDTLTVTLTGQIITLTDVNGNRSYIEGGDIPQGNGLVQVVNGVLIPDLG